MNELKQAHKLVWDFRAMMEPYWATPEPLDSLRYAFCEAGEAMDAWLRQQRPDDSRNHERHNDVLEELADCAIMLLTAVPRDKYPQRSSWDIPLVLDELAFEFSQIFDMATCSTTSIYFIRKCLFLADSIAAYPGMDLIPEIKKRLERIAYKHGNEETEEPVLMLLGQA